MNLTEFNATVTELIKQAKTPTGNIFYMSIEDKSEIEDFLSMFKKTYSIVENEYDFLGNTIIID